MSSVTLQLGSLCVALDLGTRPHAELDIIRRRYGSFFTRSRPDYVLRCLPARMDRAHPPSVWSDGSSLRCSASRFEWSLDLETGIGTARWMGRAQDLDSLLRTLAASLLPRHGGAMLHAAAFRWKGRGHLFVGCSGAGKTTLARRLDRVPGLRRLSDELVILEKNGPGYRLSSSPFWGEFSMPENNGSAPLDSLFLLEKAKSVTRITAVSSAQAQRKLLQCWVCFERTPDVFSRSWDLLVDVAFRRPKAALRWNKSHDPSNLAEILWMTTAGRPPAADGPKRSRNREVLAA